MIDTNKLKLPQAEITNDSLKEAFEGGKYDTFFKAWNSIVPKNDAYAKKTGIHKLEFYLRVYFSIFPLHPINDDSPNEKLFKK